MLYPLTEVVDEGDPKLDWPGVRVMSIIDALVCKCLNVSYVFGELDGERGEFQSHGRLLLDPFHLPRPQRVSR